MNNQVKKRSLSLSDFLSEEEIALLPEYHSSNISTDMRVLTAHKDEQSSVANGKTDYSPEYLGLVKKFNSLISFN